MRSRVEKTIYLTDNSSPEDIRETMGMSKKTFKQAIGKLYRYRKIALFPDRIEFIEKITDNPRKILRLKNPEISEGAKVNLTVFTPAEEWTYEEKNIVSKSKNSPFIGKTFKGKIIKVIV